MALQATLYRFKVELSDIDRSLYESIDFRIAMHPSESPSFLVTRALAYLLNFQPGLEFSPKGLGDPDVAPLFITDPRGGLKLWIEIGSPSARRLHTASKAAGQVIVYHYKDPKLWLHEMQSSDIFEFEKVQIHSFEASFLLNLTERLERSNEWTLIHQDSSLNLQIKSTSLEGEVLNHQCRD